MVAPGWIISLSVILLSTFAAWMQSAKGIWFIDLNVCKFFTDSLSILLLLQLCRHLSAAPRSIRNALHFICDASFFVYLSHCFFLTFGTISLESRGITDITALLFFRILLAYGIPFILYGLWKALSMHKINQPVK